MFKPAKMKKIRIFALKSILPTIIKSLHELGMVEIRKFTLEGLERGRPLSFFDEVSEQLVKLRSMASLMDQDIVKSVKVKEMRISGKEAVENARKIDAEAGIRLREISKESRILTEDISKVSQQIETVEKLRAFKGLHFGMLSSKSVTYAIGEISPTKLIPLKDKLGKVLKHFNLLAPETKESKNVALILYDRESPSPDAALGEAGFLAIQLPEDMTTPESTLTKLYTELKEKEAHLKTLESERKKLSEGYAKNVLAVIPVLDIEAERTEISSKFAFSKSASVIEGWIKEKDFENVRREIERYGSEAMLEEASIEKGEQPPIVLENPKYQHPFEFITKSFSIPNYFELDPTLVYFIGLPLIYGMIVGDVIYGIFSLLIALGFMKIFSKSEIMKSVAGIWYLSGFPAILFGILFDEWAGLTHAQWFEVFSEWGLPIATSPLYTAVLHRLHDFSLLLGITLLVGMIHVGAGFILGAITLWKDHRKHAIAKLAWLGAEIGGVVAIAAGYFGMLPAAVFIPSLVLFGISVVVLVYIEGAIGALELPGLVGNILSYARIAAVGVAGVVLAEVINDFLIPAPEAGLLALLLVPLLIILHLVNTFIAMFESLIQVGRLNIIEFKSKFLEGGGVLFTPFALKKKY